MKLALASCRELPEPDFDAAPLGAALDAEGIETTVAGWDDPSFDWAAPDAIVLRSTWNYPQRLRAFLEWAGRVDGSAALWNPLPVVRWNTHKRYLVELASMGLPTTPTELVTRGSVETLDALRVRNGWDDVVVKPAVSAASFRTLRLRDAGAERAEEHLQALVRDGDTLVQPYLESVDGYGERALVWIDGELTHAVRKSPRFFGSDESVSDEAMPIDPAEAELARAAIAAVSDADLLYARIDVAPGLDGRPVLMELELVEPSLFFAQSENALARFVAGIKKRLAMV